MKNSLENCQNGLYQKTNMYKILISRHSPTSSRHYPTFPDIPRRSPDRREKSGNVGSPCGGDLTNEHFLTQHVTTPTHVEGGVLDLVFSNNSYIVHSYNTLKPLRSTSDHFVIEVNTPIMSNETEQEDLDQLVKWADINEMAIQIHVMS